jgi:(E)-4-hydroxy-3-methylbut-2-enyl-diphosphate synthase
MTKIVKIGNKLIGGGNQVAVQSMANVKTADIDKVVSQILSLQELGCDIIRVAVKDEADVQAIKAIKSKISIPFLPMVN